MEATPLPASEKLLWFFMAFLKQEGLRHQTAKAYLLAVRYLQISSGMGNPNKSEMPRLELVVRGFKILQGAAPEDTAPHYSRYPPEESTTAGRRLVQSGISSCGLPCVCFNSFLQVGEAVDPQIGNLTHHNTFRMQMLQSTTSGNHHT